jgi:hypothetical protein
VQEASDRSASLKAVVSKLNVRFPAGATATLDRAPIASGSTIAIDGGAHTITVRASCKKSWEENLSIAPRGALHEVNVVLVDDPSCGGALAARAEGGRPRQHRTLAWIAGGAGIAALGTGSVFGLLALGHRSDLDGLCRDYPNGCVDSRRTDVESTYDAVQTTGLVSTIGFAAGAILLAGAAYLWFR